MATVLVVDDEKDIRKLYCSVVSGQGHEVLSAKNVEEAKHILLSEKDVDVALVDRILSLEESGLDILKLIQEHKPLCQTIIVSGYPTFRSASEALRLNAFDYLTKPVPYQKLIEVIGHALKEKRIQEKRVATIRQTQKNYNELMSKQEILQHDMRSLLVGIMGFSNLLINKTELNDRQHEYCQQIQKCAIQLENMVNTYLDLSHLEQKDFQADKTKFNFLDIAKQSKKTLRFLADEKNVDISVILNKKILSLEDVLFFEGDRVYLQNALDNLLKNAIEASPPDSRVKIKVKSSDEFVWILIHNWGTVPNEIRHIFFDKYSTSGKKDGMGLGTYMGRLVVESHGGKISYKSSDDEGTEVSIALPFL